MYTSCEFSNRTSRRGAISDFDFLDDLDMKEKRSGSHLADDWIYDAPLPKRIITYGRKSTRSKPSTGFQIKGVCPVTADRLTRSPADHSRVGGVQQEDGDLALLEGEGTQRKKSARSKALVDSIVNDIFQTTTDRFTRSFTRRCKARRCQEGDEENVGSLFPTQRKIPPPPEFSFNMEGDEDVGSTPEDSYLARDRVKASPIIGLDAAVVMSPTSDGKRLPVDSSPLEASLADVSTIHSPSDGLDRLSDDSEMKSVASTAEGVVLSPERSLSKASTTANDSGASHLVWTPSTRLRLQSKLGAVSPGTYQATSAIAHRAVSVHSNITLPPRNFLDALDDFGSTWEEVRTMLVEESAHLIICRDQAREMTAQLLTAEPSETCIAQWRVKDLSTPDTSPVRAYWSPPKQGIATHFVNFIRERFSIGEGRNIAFAIGRYPKTNELLADKLIYTIATTDGPPGGTHSELLAWDALPHDVKETKRGLIYTERQPCMSGSNCNAKLKEAIGDGCHIVYSIPMAHTPGTSSAKSKTRGLFMPPTELDSLMFAKK